LTLAIAEIILEAIRNNELTELNLSHQGLTDQDIFRLCLALNQNTSLTTLNVAGNNIGAAGATALARNATLTTLNVRHNHIGADGATALEGNETLTTLDEGENNIPAIQRRRILARMEILKNANTVASVPVMK
jgi:hypothetical protein